LEIFAAMYGESNNLWRIFEDKMSPKHEVQDVAAATQLAGGVATTQMKK
jgi:hypothetical protein